MPLSPRIGRCLAWVGWPATLAAALCGHTVALAAGLPPAVSGLIGATVALAAVRWLERALPHRPAWAPRPGDIAVDAGYMVAVQLLVPAGCVLALSAALGGGFGSAALGGNGLALVDLWPADWPMAAQLALKIGLGDGLRYGLHRAAHVWEPLWRLHRVHHRPQRLYASSVARFHPAEKALQFLCDTLPFLLLGAGAELLGWYFVLYSAAGFLQHANADLRLGWANAVLSGPELHRLHHADDRALSSCNYAHTLALWDRVFGTWRSPAAPVARVGLWEAARAPAR